MPQNFLENLEQTNLILSSNQMIPNDITKKRNKSSTKSYNNKDQIENIDMSYSTHLTKKNHLTNNFMDVS